MLLPMLTDPEMELPLAQHTTKMYLEPAFKFDDVLACQLLEQMQQVIDEAVDKTNLTPKQLGSSVEIIDIINEALPDGEKCPMKWNQPKPGKKRKRIPALAKDDEGMKQLLAHGTEAVRNIALARQAVKSWPKELCRIEKMLALSDAAGGMLPVPAKYCGAHTGRWQGEGGINLFNLGGHGRGGKANHPLLGKVRSLLRANDYHSLVIVDSAQIEARVLAWLSGQDDLTEDFRVGADIYSKFATKLFNSYVRKSRKDDPPVLAKQYDLRRGFGKDAILGSGYGMGATKFYNNCMANISLRPLFDAGTYDYNFIESLIKLYRRTYSMVPRLWNQTEKMFRWVVKYPHEVMRYAYPGTRVGEHDLLTIWNQEGTVYLQLPSGRCLVYDNARIRRGDDQLVYRTKSPLWGGTLVENLCQSIARDLLGYWILECEKQDIPVIHHVYDEIITFAVDFEAEIVLNKVMAIMRTVPDWAAGLPVDAEGQITQVYTK
jgi:DNA polymerase